MRKKHTYLDYWQKMIRGWISWPFPSSLPLGWAPHRLLSPLGYMWHSTATCVISLHLNGCQPPKSWRVMGKQQSLHFSPLQNLPWGCFRGLPETDVSVHLKVFSGNYDHYFFITKDFTIDQRNEMKNWNKAIYRAGMKRGKGNCLKASIVSSHRQRRYVKHLHLKGFSFSVSHIICLLRVGLPPSNLRKPWVRLPLSSLSWKRREKGDNRMKSKHWWKKWARECHKGKL